MRATAILFLLLVGAQASSAPAPLPKPPKPKPAVVRPFWEVDFSPLASAGKVNLSIRIVVRTADGTVRQMSVGQSGQVLVAPIIDAFAGSFQSTDLVINPRKTRMTMKSLNGSPVTSVELTLENLDRKYTPLVLPAGKK
jgi:hypothetical protein